MEGEADFVRIAMNKIVDVLLQRHKNPASKSIHYASGEELKRIFKEKGIELQLDDVQGSHVYSNLLDVIDLVKKYSTDTGSVLFNNQLYGTVDLVGVVGDILASVLNTNSHTFEVSPIFTIMEKELLSKFARVVGGQYLAGFDGVFLPGGSLCNQYAMHLARHRLFPDFKTEGYSVLKGRNLIAYTSSESHYSYLKSTNLLGIGTSNLIKICCVCEKSDFVYDDDYDQDALINNTGSMSPVLLEKAIQETIKNNDIPFFVGCTAGTTVLGSFDKFDEIADICKKNNIWMHVDGSWGAAALFSKVKNVKALVTGVGRSNSICWNPHKVIGSPLQTSIFLTSYGEKEHDLLHKANSAKASYLFQADKNCSSLDIGDKTLHCGRKPDSFKLWLMWKHLGDAGLQKRVDHLIDLIRYMSLEIKTRVDENNNNCFVQVYPNTFLNLCFYLIPPSMRDSLREKNQLIKSNNTGIGNGYFDLEQATDSQLAYLKTIGPIVKDRMQRKGLALIGFQPIGDFPNCWRMVLAGAKENTLTKEHIDLIITSMLEVSSDL